MPKIKRMTLSLGETLNLGNFESFRVEVTVEVELEEGDKPNDVYEKLSNTVRKKLDYEINKGETEKESPEERTVEE